MNRRTFLQAAIPLGPAVLIRHKTRAKAVAVGWFDTVRSMFVNGNLGVGTSPHSDDRAKALFYNAAEMVFAVFKTGGDSNDLNVDGAILVKHHKNYTATPGYAHTFQVYAEAGMQGIAVGNNDFVGLDSSRPYNPTPSAVPDGFVRFELGPLWPYSEVARFNNRGDLILGWNLIRKSSGSQSGTTVVGSDFTPADVGRFVCWGDYENGGKDAHADRIVGFVSADRVTVETPRSINAQAFRVCTPQALIRDGVLHLAESDPGDVAKGTVAVFVQDGALKVKADDGTVTTLAGRA